MSRVEIPLKEGLLHGAIETLGNAVAQELGEILASARSYERQIQQALADSRLLSRSEAASHLNASVSQVDRWVNSGLLEVVTLDRRPRFQLAELNRFVSIHSGRKNRRTIRPRNDPQKN